MKQVITGILVLISLIGLCLAGSEVQEIKTQLIVNVTGAMMFAGGGYFACLINKERRDNGTENKNRS
jgi:heme O synthase-like polyprenyltransferase